MSRNVFGMAEEIGELVTSREGRVSRNVIDHIQARLRISHVPRGACE